MSLAVGSRYARALAQVVFSERGAADPDVVLAEIRKFGEAMDTSRPLRDILASPAVARGKKRDLIEKLASQMGLSQTTRNFLIVVASHGRLQMLRSIGDAFQAAIDQQRGIAPAEVVSAVELTDEQRSEFEAQVASLTGKKARCAYRVDPAILGGAVLKIGSSVYDGSVAGQLQRLGAKLAVGA
jgi:F-type H+-transporting ATPase subunit delta